MVFARLLFFWCTWLQGSIVFQCCTACDTSWPKLGLYISSLSVPFSLLIQINGLRKKCNTYFTVIKLSEWHRTAQDSPSSSPVSSVTGCHAIFFTVSQYRNFCQNHSQLFKRLFLGCSTVKMHWKRNISVIPLNRNIT